MKTNIMTMSGFSWESRRNCLSQCKLATQAGIELFYVI